MSLLRLFASVSSIVETLLNVWRQQSIKQRAIKEYQSEQENITQDIIDNMPDELPKRLLDDYERN